MSKSKPASTKKLSRDQLEAQLKRTLADYQNLQKRIDSHQTDFVKFANATLLDKLLSVLDDLERAETHLKDQGLNLALDQFRSILKSEGIEELKVLNTPFDPQTSDCAELVKGKKNQVIHVIQKGYTLHQKVLRPAKVKVGQGG